MAPSSVQRPVISLLMDAPVAVPTTMAACLDADDPVAALQALAAAAQQLSLEQSQQLAQQLTASMYQHALPSILETTTTTTTTTTNQQQQQTSNPRLTAATACADSIQHSLTKIASGGSAASQEIRALESQKDALTRECAAIHAAVQFRQAAAVAAQSLSAQSYAAAAESVRPWLLWSQQGGNRNDSNKANDRANDNKNATATTTANDDDDDDNNDSRRRTAAYAGQYCLAQLATTHTALRQAVLDLYQAAVEQGDLQALGQLTPVLSQIQLTNQALQMYLQFLKLSILQPAMEQAVQARAAEEALFLPMARVYNAAVSTLRHHLPMVSHCLHEAAGDVAVVQLVQMQVQDFALPVLTKFQRQQQLGTTAHAAARIYAALEERYAGTRLHGSLHRHGNDDDDGDDDDAGVLRNTDDCGFAAQVGSLSDVDAALEEAALCIQHAESYTRFVQHCASQVQQARQLRFQHSRAETRRERERQEWQGGGKKKNAGNGNKDKTDNDDDELEAEYTPIEILPASTPLDQAVAELGGQYAGIERCLLLASMQRAFVTSAHNDQGMNTDHGGSGMQQQQQDARYYRPLSLGNNYSTSGGGGNSKALQTTLVETCLYAARRGTQRAFATGHTGTASAMTNFCVDCLQNVLLEVLSHRAEESGVALLKPGDGLLVGSAGIFNATSNLIRQGTNVSNAVIPRSHKDELVRKQRVLHDIGRACATLNDLEVAIYHTQHLESVLTDATAKGFPPATHATEQLQMCVKSLSTVTDSFKMASDATVESFVAVLRPRIRSIVGEAIGGEGGTSSAASAFMGSSVMGGGKTGEKITVRMNYNLDENAYNLQQLGEGYVARLCALLDDLLEPVRQHLAPRLWDALLIGVTGTVCKRLETSLRSKCEYTSLGALTLDSDMRDMLHYTKEHLYGEEYRSNVAVAKACPPLNRLLQITKLLNVDDLEDVLDLISSSKRKGNWDLKLEDAKAYLSLRVEFESANVNELLRLPDE